MMAFSSPTRPYICQLCIRRFDTNLPRRTTAPQSLSLVTRPLATQKRTTHGKPRKPKSSVPTPAKSTASPSARRSDRDRVDNPKHAGSVAIEPWQSYWETLVPTPAHRAEANHYFTRKASASFLTSCARFREVPSSDLPEVAFVGRSNVGKSSLLNALVEADVKDVLARTSKRPGFTKTMNMFGVSGVAHPVKLGKTAEGHAHIRGRGGFVLVDLPGYGKASQAEWGEEIMKYLSRRKQLRRVFVLVDAEHGIKDKDRSLLGSFRLAGIPHQVLLSKLDRIYIPPNYSQAVRVASVKGAKRAERVLPHGHLETVLEQVEKVRDEIQPERGAGALGELIGFSSEVAANGTRMGIDSVRCAVLQAVGYAFHSPEPQVPIRTIKTNVPTADSDIDAKIRHVGYD